MAKNEIVVQASNDDLDFILIPFSEGGIEYSYHMGSSLEEMKRCAEKLIKKANPTDFTKWVIFKRVAEMQREMPAIKFKRN